MIDRTSWVRPAAVWTVFAAALALLTDAAQCQETRDRDFPARNYIAPQVWTTSRAPRSAARWIAVERVEATVNIADQAATTTMIVRLHNAGGTRQEAVLLIPVPAGAAVRSFDFDGKAAEPTAKLLPARDAVGTYKRIVGELRDPALLEFAGCGLIRSSVFPVEAGARQAVRIVYEEVLKRDDNRVDYVLPRSEMLALAATPWTIAVNLKSKKAISTVYSPSHPVDFARRNATEGTVTLTGGRTTEPGSFLLSYVTEKGDVSASLLAYPDAKSGGGYFLLLAGLPANAHELGAKAVKRELTLVLDRSGSMQGNKIEQARSAALQVLEGLGEGEAFNIVDYNDTVGRFRAEPVVKTGKMITEARAYIQSVQAGGGTNLHDALLEAVRQPRPSDRLPLVLLLSDGLPTVGVTNEAQIRRAVAASNLHNRRIFTFGVGNDVNTPLLDNIAQGSRATMTVVQPEENVETKVSSLFSKLSGPILTSPSLKCVDAQGGPAESVIRDVVPSTLPDMFRGDQLVVLGRYTGEGPLRFRLSGGFLGEKKEYSFEFGLKNATMRNSFVARLWASRRIAVLADAIRQRGAEGSSVPDERMKELVDEIVRLSTEFGVLTEYTAFLADEGTDLADARAQNGVALDNFQNSAVLVRNGAYANSQQRNLGWQRTQENGNRFNDYFDADNNRVRINTVQQVGNRAFFKRGNKWIDARAVKKGAVPEPDEVVEFGSARFDEVLKRLAAENDQGLLSLGTEAVFELDGKVIKVVFSPKDK